MILAIRIALKIFFLGAAACYVYFACNLAKYVSRCARKGVQTPIDYIAWIFACAFVVLSLITAAIKL